MDTTGNAGHSLHYTDHDRSALPGCSRSAPARLPYFHDRGVAWGDRAGHGTAVRNDETVLSLFPVIQIDLISAHSLSFTPCKYPRLSAHRIDDNGNLPRQREMKFLGAQVGGREENSHAGMRMVPAKNCRIVIEPIPDCLPRSLVKGKMGRVADGIHRQRRSDIYVELTAIDVCMAAENACLFTQNVIGCMFLHAFQAALFQKNQQRPIGLPNRRGWRIQFNGCQELRQLETMRLADVRTCIPPDFFCRCR